MSRILCFLLLFSMCDSISGQSLKTVALPVISTGSELNAVRAALESADRGQRMLGILAARSLDPTDEVVEARLEERLAACIAEEEFADSAIEALADWPLRRAAFEALLTAQDKLNSAFVEEDSRLATRKRLAVVISTFPDDRNVTSLEKALGLILASDVDAGMQVADEFLRVKSLKLYQATRRAVSKVPQGSSKLRKLLSMGRYELTSYKTSLGELPTAAQRQWVIALGAPYILLNGGDTCLLAGRGRSRHSLQDYRQSLSAWWGIEDAAGFRETVAWLQNGGQRDYQAELIDRVRALSPEEQEELETVEEQLVVRMLRDGTLAKHGTAGWDYVRLGSMAGWGYVCEYLTLDEAMSLGLSAAREAQKSFNSWEELYASFMAGRMIWVESDSDEVMKEMRVACRWLMEDPKSPCKRVDWKLNLSQ